ncbi:MAG: nitrophenyl compound nitroreductase subunit ArsF family protein [Thermoanaerobaculaceae bacterium]
MTARSVLAAALGLFVLAAVVTIVVKEARRSGAMTQTGARMPQEGAHPGRRVLVTYFVTNTRCVSCYQIETLTEASLRAAFPSELATGVLEWRLVNTDEPEHAHFVTDYQLYTKSVIVSEIEGGVERRWKNLERVWKLLDRPEELSHYVTAEVRAFVEHS